MARRRARRRSPTPKTRSARRGGGARPDPRRLGLVVALLVLLAVLPPTRRVLARGWDAVEAAMLATRAAEARERMLAEYARRYGIGRDMADAIERAAREERVETDLAFRLVRVESGFHERAVSPVGALGLTQLMPATAAELRPGITREEIFERDTNLRLGFRYFRWLLTHYDGDVEEALHAYNRGIGTVARIRRAGGDPANGYAEKVLGESGASPVRRRAPADTAPDAPVFAPAHELGPARLPAGM